ncbi:hypothetical protein LGR54_22855 [Ancylobacter sp. Lp-2]|uniref:hypothetical protein n=1 Tax=Ancylobacter sp. Lp-2 TaxID=2881339 RepID=UPI001E44CEC8|nr:hypothetical protein [Ancylobacter sp. Lp-2]MCB4771453.1 hypothetical protein [Ancylobacter sp. Lp-2]
MKILSARRAPPGSSLLGVVDVEIGTVRLYGVEIRRAADGGLRAWPPKRGDHRVASIDSTTAIEIAFAALAALEGSVHDRAA